MRISLDDGLNEIPIGRDPHDANRKDRHHIFPRGLLAALGIPAKLYNSICNICLLTAEENQSIGNRRPRLYLGEAKRTGTYFSRKVTRHLIPVQDSGGVRFQDAKKGFTRFLKGADGSNLRCFGRRRLGICLFRLRRNLL